MNATMEMNGRRVSVPISSEDAAAVKRVQQRRRSWVDTSPNDFRNRPHQSSTLTLPCGLKIIVYTGFEHDGSFRASFHPEIAPTVRLKARTMEDAQVEAAGIAIAAVEVMRVELALGLGGHL